MPRSTNNYRRTMDRNGNVLTRRGQGNTTRSMSGYIRERGSAFADQAQAAGRSGTIRDGAGRVVQGTAKS